MRCEAPAGMPSTPYVHVYLLRSTSTPEQYYTGCTEDLDTRLVDHNRGHVHHTAKYRPWRVEVAIAFRDKTMARRFEKYLKTGSGREFARRHFRCTPTLAAQRRA